MNNDKKSILSTVLFFGAVWGFLEATLGYLLHWTPDWISGSVMFPIGAFLVIRAYLKTGSRKAALLVGVVAAGIKAFDFLLPLPPQGPIRIFVPMYCILIEAAVAVLVIPLLDKNRAGSRWWALPVASTAWRLGYVALIWIRNGSVPVLIATPEAFLSFFGTVNAVSSVLALALHELNRGWAKSWDWKWTRRPVFASLALLVSVAVSMLFAFYL